MKKLCFQVKYRFSHNGQTHEGIEEEASWFLIDQRGNFYGSGPMEPPYPIKDEYEELIPLIKIDDEYLSVEEIEQRLSVEALPDLLEACKAALMKCPFPVGAMAVKAKLKAAIAKAEESP